MKEKLIDYLAFSLIEVIYLIATCIYLFKLHALNRVLSPFSDNAYEVLTYKDGIAIYYFVIALVMMGIGAFIIKWRLSQFKNKYLQEEEKMAIIINVIVICCLFLAIWIFINNPILRAVILALIGVGITGFTLSNN